MLIKSRNPDLFRAWLRILGDDTPTKRTDAFFRAQRGEIPWIGVYRPTTQGEGE